LLLFDFPWDHVQRYKLHNTFKTLAAVRIMLMVFCSLLVQWGCIGASTAAAVGSRFVVGCCQPLPK
jgi:hypothetical protein